MEPVQISPRAMEEIQKIYKNKKIPPEYGLRLTIKGGKGCAGVQFTLGFDKQKEDDVSFEKSGIEVYIRKGEMMYLIGKKVDFYDGADARGFLFLDQDDNSTVAR
jgi:iron-sulfur cluster assembly protein